METLRTPDDRFADLPYLQATYDEPEFVVRSVWRLYGGWWDGDPARLKPAPAVRLASEIASLAGGAERLAGHLAELAFTAEPGSARVRAVQACPDLIEDELLGPADRGSKTWAQRP